MISLKQDSYFVLIQGIFRPYLIFRLIMNWSFRLLIIILIMLALLESRLLVNGFRNIKSAIFEQEMLLERQKKSIKLKKTESNSAFRLFLMMEDMENMEEHH